MLSGQKTLEKGSEDARLSVVSNLDSICWHGEESKFDGGLEYFEERGEEFDESRSSWQTAFGAAPVEESSVFGYHVTWFTALFLNIGSMVGVGIFTTPATILKGAGSVGLSLIFWAVGFLIAGSQLSVYLELASYFPNRSGAEVVYLEQAYPRPRFMVLVAFAVQYMLLSFASSAAVVVSQSLWAAAEKDATAWEEKGLAVACMTLIAIMVVFSTKISLRLSNLFGIMKIIILIFICITGLVVLAGHTKVQNPSINFEHAFENKNSGPSIASTLVTINVAYFGYTNSVNMVNEIKNPVRTLKKTAPASLAIVAILYMLVNIAYFAAIPSSTIISSSQNISTLFFTSVFSNTSAATKASNILIAFSAFSNILTSLIGSSRLIRESARQGVLPFPTWLADTNPFGTPLNVYTVKYILTIIMILAPPNFAGDAFAFIAGLQGYPSAVFAVLTTTGLLVIRRRRLRMGLGVGNEGFKCWTLAIYFSILVNLYLLVMPFIPPTPTFQPYHTIKYFTTPLVGLGILFLSAIISYLYFHLLPNLFGYVIKNEWNDGLVKVTRLVWVKMGSDLEMWEAEHDVKGKKLDGSAPLGHVILEGLDFSDLSWTRTGGTGGSEGQKEGSREGSRDGLIV